MPCCVTLEAHLAIGTIARQFDARPCDFKAVLIGQVSVDLFEMAASELDYLAAAQAYHVLVSFTAPDLIMVAVAS